MSLKAYTKSYRHIKVTHQEIQMRHTNTVTQGGERATNDQRRFEIDTATQNYNDLFDS